MDRGTVSSRPKRPHSHRHQYTNHCHCHGNLEHLHGHWQPDSNRYSYPHYYVDPYHHRDPVPASDAYPFANPNTEPYTNTHALSNPDSYPNTPTVFYTLLHKYADDYSYSFGHAHTDDHRIFTATTVGVFSSQCQIFFHS